MSCPTCSATMHMLVSSSRSVGFHWCPRCGTIRHKDVTWVPKIVERCRTLEADVVTVADDDSLLAIWTRLGIAESINLPRQRPGEGGGR